MEKLRYSGERIDKEETIEGLFEDPILSNFFIDNDLNNEIIENNLPKLLSFKTEKDNCLECVGLEYCKQDNIGLSPTIVSEEGTIRIYYKECNFVLDKKNKEMKKQLINAMYMPEMVLKADLEDYRNDTKNRMEIYRYMMKFLNFLSRGEIMKGMYLTGKYQEGKTYTLAALAKELTKRNYSVILAYYPDLSREVKSTISGGGLEVLINKLKAVDVLMLDDIGGEAQSSWVRDEVLGPVLQHRLLDNKPTFFSSNVTQKDLPSYMVANNQKAELMKAYRIHARIESLTEEFNM
jgi:primosomal protein DnaI